MRKSNLFLSFCLIAEFCLYLIAKVASANCFQDTTIHTDSALTEEQADSVAANHYAPVLFFSAVERYYPTIPFYNKAYDWRSVAPWPGDSTRYDSLRSEKCPIQYGNEVLYKQGAGIFFDNEMKRPDSWPDLIAQYDEEFDAEGKSSAWVFWDKRKVSVADFQKIFHQLEKKNHSSVTRLNELTTELENDSLNVFRYWMYYFKDTGPQAHPQDVEIIYVIANNTLDEFSPPVAIIGTKDSEMGMIVNFRWLK